MAQYGLDLLTLILIYATAAVSLDLLVGYTGMLSLSQAAFFGIGAYTSALLATCLGAPFILSVVAGAAVGAILSMFASLPSARLRGDYFFLSTLAFQMIMFGIFNNCTELTGGPTGIPGIPRPVIFGWRVDSPWEFAVMSGLLACFAYWVVRRLTTHPFGRVLRAIREDEIVANALGKNTLRFKITAFALSAAMMAAAGSLYAHYMTYIDPTGFTAMESILMLSMVIIGGAGSSWGPVLGAMVLVSMPEAMRFVGLPSSVAANLRQILYGCLLLVFMRWRPQGFLGEYSFQKGNTRG